jgi:hypothetical protein
VRYEYKSGIPDNAYPDFRYMARDIEAYLANYPNEVDYWELVNKKLTAIPLEKYTVLRKIAAEITVSPTALDPCTAPALLAANRVPAPHEALARVE